MVPRQPHGLTKADIVTALDATALKELVDEKLKGHKIRAPKEEGAPAGKVVDLMAALRKSIRDAPAKASVRTGKPAERRQSAGRAKR